MNSQIRELIIKTMKDIYADYQTNANYFFNEDDFHHRYIRAILKSEFGKQLFNLIHPEYPTRCCLKEDLTLGYVEGGKSRGYYDVAILAEDFYREYGTEFDIIANKMRNEQNKEKLHDRIYLDAAIEFKYFHSKDEKKLLPIKKDVAKLKLASEANEKYFFIILSPVILADKNFIESIRKLDFTGINAYLNGELLNVPKP